MWLFTVFLVTNRRAASWVVLRCVGSSSSTRCSAGVIGSVSRRCLRAARTACARPSSTPASGQRLSSVLGLHEPALRCVGLARFEARLGEHDMGQEHPPPGPGEGLKRLSVGTPRGRAYVEVAPLVGEYTQVREQGRQLRDVAEGMALGVELHRVVPAALLGGDERLQTERPGLFALIADRQRDAEGSQRSLRLAVEIVREPVQLVGEDAPFPVSLQLDRRGRVLEHAPDAVGREVRPQHELQGSQACRAQRRRSPRSSVYVHPARACLRSTLVGRVDGEQWSRPGSGRDCCRMSSSVKSSSSWTARRYVTAIQVSVTLGRRHVGD